MKRMRKVVAALMLMMAVVFVVGCKTPKGDFCNGHEYVDLDLPSGTLWATCNVGANTPEEYGDYFAWGETMPKDIYNWSTYRYCNGGLKQLTKYCFNADYGCNGFIDNLIVLQSVDDAATVNWGSGWCLPTETQWKELRDNTSYTWTTRNGINGALFTATNGNCLFLPAAGSYKEGNSKYYVNVSGKYWSSSLDNYDSFSVYRAWGFYFNSHVSKMSEYRRGADGCSVRPVRSSAKN